MAWASYVVVLSEGLVEGFSLVCYSAANSLRSELNPDPLFSSSLANGTDSSTVSELSLFYTLSDVTISSTVLGSYDLTYEFWETKTACLNCFFPIEYPAKSPIKNAANTKTKHFVREIPEDLLFELGTSTCSLLTLPLFFKFGGEGAGIFTLVNSFFTYLNSDSLSGFGSSLTFLLTGKSKVLTSFWFSFLIASRFCVYSSLSK